MRGTFDIRLSLSESESTAVAVAAFYAKVPLLEWVKARLLDAAQAQQAPAPETTVAPVAVAQPPIREPAPAPEPVAAEPAPDPANAAEPETPESAEAPEKKRRSRIEYPPGSLPEGFEAIMGLAEKLAEERQRVIDNIGSAKGYSYNRAMAAWYEQHMPNISTSLRHLLGVLGTNAKDVRAWYERQAPGAIADDIQTFALHRMWSSASPDETVVFRDNKLQRVPVSEAFGTGAAGSADKDTDADQDQIGQPSKTQYPHFGMVDLDKLEPYERRAVRRFTERISNLGGASTTMPEDKIALAIRKIRGKEEGDNPEIANALIRLGVMVGSSGAYRLRSEYVERYPLVSKWVEGAVTGK